MTFAQRRNRHTTHFSERITVVKRRISVSQTRQGMSHETARSVQKLLQGLQTGSETYLIVSKEMAMCAVLICYFFLLRGLKSFLIL
jgi:hypothetical protein